MSLNACGQALRTSHSRLVRRMCSFAQAHGEKQYRDQSSPVLVEPTTSPPLSWQFRHRAIPANGTSEQFPGFKWNQKPMHTYENKINDRGVCHRSFGRLDSKLLRASKKTKHPRH